MHQLPVCPYRLAMGDRRTPDSSNCGKMKISDLSFIGTLILVALCSLLRNIKTLTSEFRMHLRASAPRLLQGVTYMFSKNQWCSWVSLPRSRVYKVLILYAYVFAAGPNEHDYLRRIIGVRIGNSRTKPTSLYSYLRTDCERKHDRTSSQSRILREYDTRLDVALQNPTVKRY